MQREEPKIKYAEPTRKPLRRTPAFAFKARMIGNKSRSPIRIRKEDIDFITARTLLNNHSKKNNVSNLEKKIEADIFITPVPPCEQKIWGNVDDDIANEIYDIYVRGEINDALLLDFIDSIEPKYNISRSPINKDKKPIAYIDLLFFSFIT